jgi:hypothetical protein
LLSDTIVKSFIYNSAGDLAKVTCSNFKFTAEDVNPTKILHSKKQWERVKSFFNAFYNNINNEEYLESQEKEASFWLEFFEHIFEYYLNLIPPYK